MFDRAFVGHCVDLQLLYFICLWALLALGDLEGHLVALIDLDTGLETSYMYEVILAILACDESEVLYAVEKLDCSVYHF